MLTCRECGGTLFVVGVEDPPEHLTKQEKLIYNRLCNVKCISCEKIFYSQPYDYGKTINPIKNIQNKL